MGRAIGSPTWTEDLWVRASLARMWALRHPEIPHPDKPGPLGCMSFVNIIFGSFYSANLSGATWDVAAMQSHISRGMWVCGGHVGLQSWLFPLNPQPVLVGYEQEAFFFFFSFFLFLGHTPSIRKFPGSGLN